MPALIPFMSQETLKGEVKSYEILEKFDEGASGIIYKAMEKDNPDNIVAIKSLLLPQTPDDDGQKLYRKVAEHFYREIKLLSELSSIHGVVDVFDYGCLQKEFWDTQIDIPWYAMPCFENVPFTEALQDKLLALKVKLFKKVINTMTKVHQKKVLHRDLKPSNILLDKKGDPVILDFGIATVLSMGANSLSFSMSRIGTPLYMAPEQFADPKTKNYQTDIWALGVIMYELLVGENPFMANNLMQCRKNICELDLIPLQEFEPNVDMWLAEVCYRALQKDPKNRYEKIELMADALEKWEEQNFTNCIENCKDKIEAHDWSNAQYFIRKAYTFLIDDNRLKQICSLYVQNSCNVSEDQVEIMFISDPGKIDVFMHYIYTLKRKPFDLMSKIYHVHDIDQPYWIALEKPDQTLFGELTADELTGGVNDELILEITTQLIKIYEYCTKNKLPYPKIKLNDVYCNEDDYTIKIILKDFSEDFEEQGIVNELLQYVDIDDADSLIELERYIKDALVPKQVQFL